MCLRDRRSSSAREREEEEEDANDGFFFHFLDILFVLKICMALK